MKKICLCIVSFLVLVSSHVFADIPKEEMYIGGIGIGTDREYVIQNYGSATLIEKYKNRNNEDIVEEYYGLIDSRFKQYEITISYKNNKVTAVWVRTDTLSTPKGLKCNMVEDNINMYGKADEMGGGKNIGYRYYNKNNSDEVMQIHVSPVTHKIVAIGVYVQNNR